MITTAKAVSGKIRGETRFTTRPRSFKAFRFTIFAPGWKIILTIIAENIICCQLETQPTETNTYDSQK